MNTNSSEINKAYRDYKKKVVNLLVKYRTWEKDGVWQNKSKYSTKKHILPLRNNVNNPVNRAEAIKNCLDFDCTPYFPKGYVGLHPYTHHLTSSQLLCLQFFAKLIDIDKRATKQMVEFIKNALGIDINIGAQCAFEYTEKNEPYLFDSDKDGKIIPVYEGTSFDFHIKDDAVEIYFEIKFTEDGFKKEKRFKKDRKIGKQIEDKRHMAKAERYLAENVAPEFFRKIIKEPEEFLNQYQIYRNIIRVTDSNKYVVFISDRNNPLTKQDAESIESIHFHDNVIFTTWQQLISKYPFELPIQLKAIHDYEE